MKNGRRTHILRPRTTHRTFSLIHPGLLDLLATRTYLGFRESFGKYIHSVHPCSVIGSGGFQWVGARSVEALPRTVPVRLCSNLQTDSRVQKFLRIHCILPRSRGSLSSYTYPPTTGPAITLKGWSTSALRAFLALCLWQPNLLCNQTRFSLNYIGYMDEPSDPILASHAV